MHDTWSPIPLTDHIISRPQTFMAEPACVLIPLIVSPAHQHAQGKAFIGQAWHICPCHHPMLATGRPIICGPQVPASRQPLV